jgi:hypothetical protein
MTYSINRTDGTVLTTILDETIDSWSTDLSLIGRNVPFYGEMVNENFVKLLDTFASRAQPVNPIRGQLWYDKSDRRVKVFNGNEFRVIGGAIVSNTLPDFLVKGDMWIDSAENQLWFFDGEDLSLVGPDYKESQGISGFRVDTIRDTNGNNRVIVKLWNEKRLIGIFSSYSDPFTPREPISSFTGQIYPGFNQSNLLNLKFKGRASVTDALLTTAGERKFASDFMITDGDTGTTGTVYIFNKFPLLLGEQQDSTFYVDPDGTFKLIGNNSYQSFNLSTSVDAPSFVVNNALGRVGIFNTEPETTLDISGSLASDIVTVGGNLITPTDSFSTNNKFLQFELTDISKTLAGMMIDRGTLPDVGVRWNSNSGFWEIAVADGLFVRFVKVSDFPRIAFTASFNDLIDVPNSFVSDTNWTLNESNGSIYTTSNIGVGLTSPAYGVSVNGSFHANVIVVRESELTSNVIDASQGSIFSKSITNNVEFSVSNLVTPSSQISTNSTESSDVSFSLVLDLKGAGSYNITWPVVTQWKEGAAPILSTVGSDIIGLSTDNSGKTWTGMLVASNVQPSETPTVYFVNYPESSFNFDKIIPVIDNLGQIVCLLSGVILGARKSFVVRFSTTGQLLMAKEISSSEEVTFNNITINNTGNIFLVGRYNDGTSLVGTILRLNSGGLILRQYKYSRLFTQGTSFTHIAVSDSLIFVAAVEYSTPNNVVLASFSYNTVDIFDLHWTILSRELNDSLTVTSISAASNDFFVAWTVDNSLVKNMSIAKVDQECKIVWQKEIPNSNNVSIPLISSTTSEELFLISKFNNNSASLFKFSPNGDIAYSQSIQFNIPAGSSIDIESFASSNTSFHISGTITINGSSASMFLSVRKDNLTTISTKFWQNSNNLEGLFSFLSSTELLVTLSKDDPLFVTITPIDSTTSYTINGESFSQSNSFAEISTLPEINFKSSTDTWFSFPTDILNSGRAVAIGKNQSSIVVISTLYDDYSVQTDTSTDSVDDELLKIELPFPVIFNGNEYYIIFACTNSYILFVNDETYTDDDYSDFENLDQDRILINSHDCEVVKLVALDEIVDGNRQMRIRFVGSTLGFAPYNSSNEVYWASLYEYDPVPFNGTDYGMFQAITVDKDGNIIATGADADDENSITVVKWDKNSNLLWQKKIGVPGEYNNIYGELVTTDSDGNIYVASSNDYPLLLDSWYTPNGVYKLSPDGDLLAQIEVSLGAVNGDDYFYQIGDLVTTNDGLILSLDEGGIIFFDFNLSNLSAIKLPTTYLYSYNYSGLWTNKTSYFYFSTATRWPSGTGAERGQLWKIGLDKTPIWGKGIAYNGPSAFYPWVTRGTFFQHVTQTDNFIFSTSFWSNEVIKLDLNGNLIWAKKFTHPADTTDQSKMYFALIASYDNEVVLVGEYELPNGTSAGSVIKLDAETDEIIFAHSLKNIDEYIGWWWYYSDKGALEVNESSIVIGGYSDNNGIVYKLPRNLEDYPTGLKTADGKEFETIPIPIQDFEITDITRYISVVDITDAPTYNYTVASATTNYPINPRGNSAYTGMFVTKTVADDLANQLVWEAVFYESAPSIVDIFVETSSISESETGYVGGGVSGVYSRSNELLLEIEKFDPRSSTRIDLAKGSIVQLPSAPYQILGGAPRNLNILEFPTSRGFNIKILDETGEIELSKNYTSLLDNFSITNKIVFDTQGNFYVAAISTRSDAPNNLKTILIKLSANGDIIWQKEFVKTIDTIDTTVPLTRKASLAYSNGPIICFPIDRKNTMSAIIKLDDNGTIVWQKELDGIITDCAADQTSVYAASNKYVDFSHSNLLSLNVSNGDVIWSNRYSTSIMLIEVSENYLYVVDNTQPYDSSTEAYLTSVRADTGVPNWRCQIPANYSSSSNSVNVNAYKIPKALSISDTGEVYVSIYFPKVQAAQRSFVFKHAGSNGRDGTFNEWSRIFEKTLISSIVATEDYYYTAGGIKDLSSRFKGSLISKLPANGSGHNKLYHIQDENFLSYIRGSTDLISNNVSVTTSSHIIGPGTLSSYNLNNSLNSSLNLASVTAPVISDFKAQHNWALTMSVIRYGYAQTFSVLVGSDDSIYVMSSQRYSWTNSSTHNYPYYLVKLDKHGKILWARMQDLTFEEVYGGVIDSNDNLYYAVSNFRTDTNATVDGLKKFNSDGEVLWTYGFPQRVYSSVIAIDIDENLILGTDDGIIKFSQETFSVIWAKYINDGFDGFSGHGLVTNTTGDIFYQSWGDDSGRVTKLNSLGEVQWSKEYSTIYFNPYGLSLQGPYLYAAFSDWIMSQIMRINQTTGEPVWSKVVPGYPDPDLNVLSTSAGDVYFLVPSTDIIYQISGYDGPVSFIYKFNSSGNILWSRVAAGVIGNDYEINASNLTRNNDLLIAGAITDWGNSTVFGLQQIVSDGSNIGIFEVGEDSITFFGIMPNINLIAPLNYAWTTVNFPPDIDNWSIVASLAVSSFEQWMEIPIPMLQPELHANNKTQTTFGTEVNYTPAITNICSTSDVIFNVIK